MLSQKRVISARPPSPPTTTHLPLSLGKTKVKSPFTFVCWGALRVRSFYARTSARQLAFPILKSNLYPYLAGAVPSNLATPFRSSFANRIHIHAPRSTHRIHTSPSNYCVRPRLPSTYTFHCDETPLMSLQPLHNVGIEADTNCDCQECLLGSPSKKSRYHHL